MKINNSHTWLIEDEVYMKQHDDSRPGTFKSGGQRIDDHQWWGGKSEKGQAFPKGAKTKEEHSAGGAGSLGHYEDTTEEIKSAQEKGQAKVRSHGPKTSYRN